MNIQVITAPEGALVWNSGAVPGSVHNIKAARIWGLLRPWRSPICSFWLTKGYIGAGQYVITPYRERNKPESQKTANRSHARLADAAACRSDSPPVPETRPTAAIGVSEAELGQRIEAAGVGQHARDHYAPSPLRRFGAPTTPS